jgi:hypothetical protein
MRSTSTPILTATLLFVLSALTGPAGATKASTVAAGCVARGTECTVTTEGGGNKYCFDNSKSGQGTQCVKCPAIDDTKTDCTMALTGGKGTSVQGIMRAPARKATH